MKRLCIILVGMLFFVASCEKANDSSNPEIISNGNAQLPLEELTDEFVIIDGVKAYLPKGLTKAAFNLDRSQFLEFMKSYTDANNRGNYEFTYDQVGTEDIV